MNSGSILILCLQTKSRLSIMSILSMEQLLSEWLLDKFRIYPYPMSSDQVKAVYHEYTIYGTGP